jgi:hypothetical protein
VQRFCGVKTGSYFLSEEVQRLLHPSDIYVTPYLSFFSFFPLFIEL